MCLFSRVEETRKVKVGEQGRFGNVPGHGSRQITAFLPVKPEHGIACLCTPNSCVLQLTGLPQSIAQQAGITGNTAVVTFLEGTSSRNPDRIEFENRFTMPVDKELHGVGVTCVAMSMGDYQQALELTKELNQNLSVQEPQHVEVAQSPPEAELVGALPAGVFATARLVGAAVFRTGTMAALIVIAAMLTAS